MGGMRIFFDVDGVLIDGFHTKPERWRRWDTNIEQDLGIKSGHIEDFILRGTFRYVLHGRLDFEQEMASWLAKHGYSITAQKLIDYWHARDSSVNRPVFDVVERISPRKDVQLYTATNQAHARIAYLRDKLGWKQHFTDFYYSARLGCLKYDPHYFARIEEELQFDPYNEPPLYFDDDPRNIEVSSTRGWNAVLVDGPEDVVGHPDIQRLLT